MPQHSKDNILAGRKAVDAYRTAHTQLHSKPWHKGIPEEHTPLLKVMVKALEKQGFTSEKTEEVLAKFWDASDLLNLQELGFKDRQDFEKRATDKDREALEETWQ